MQHAFLVTPPPPENIRCKQDKMDCKRLMDGLPHKTWMYEVLCTHISHISHMHMHTNTKTLQQSNLTHTCAHNPHMHMHILMHIHTSTQCNGAHKPLLEEQKRLVSCL